MTEQYSANWKDGLMRARDKLLDRITGVKPYQVLNATPYLPSQTEKHRSCSRGQDGDG